MSYSSGPTFTGAYRVKATMARVALLQSARILPQLVDRVLSQYADWLALFFATKERATLGTISMLRGSAPNAKSRLAGVPFEFSLRSLQGA